MTANNINEVIKAWREVGVIGWAESSYGWITSEGNPVVLTDWQRAVLTAWWDNRETITTLAISNTKKTGKTFTNAVLLAWRWLALPGVHFALGNDLDQSASRQFAEISDMIRRHPFLSERVKLTGKVLTFEPTGSQLIALAQDAAGNAGANHLTASHTEAWGVLTEAAIRAYEELTPPPGKVWGLPALRIVDSYAGYEGESKTWHDLVDRGRSGKRLAGDWPVYQDGGLLLFHIEGEAAQARCYRGSQAEADTYYSEQRKTLRPNTFLRLHENRRVSGECAFLPEGVWDDCKADILPLAEHDRRRVVLGVDASTSRDHTAAVGVHWNSTDKRFDVIYCKTWKPIKGVLRLGKPTVDLIETVDAEVRRLHKAGQLAAVVCDNYQLHALITGWEKAGVKVVELAQNAGRVESDQGLYDAVISGQLRHYGDPVLTEHVKNAVAVETGRGLRLAKDRTALKIDAAVALSMALWGSREKVQRHGDNRVVVVDDPWDYEPGAGEFLHLPDGGMTWIEGKVNRTPHPPGVTWQNCPHRNHGCQVCVDEMDADGSYWEFKDHETAISDAVEMGTFARQAELIQQQRTERMIDQHERDYKNGRLLEKFWKSARRGQS